MFTEDDVIFTYTSEQAEADGILVSLQKIIPGLLPGPLNYATSNLLNRGYLDNDKANIPALKDLIRQAAGIVTRIGEDDSFYSGSIELPSGERQKIFICQNETGKFTLMLPEDY